MNLQPMQPSPYTASGDLVFVFCKRCKKTCSGADVLCDLDAAAGTYYCADCAVVLEMRSMTTAEFLAEHGPTSRALTLEGGYLVDSQGVSRSFPPGITIKERRRNGRCEWCQARFPDGSVLEFRWSETHGARYKVLAPVVI